MMELKAERPTINVEINERLAKGEWLWQKDIVDKIRADSQGRPAVVFDLDGVVRSEDGYRKISPEAKKLIEKLKERGFYLAIWTHSKRETLEGDEIEELVNLVDLVITRENYDLNTNVSMPDNDLVRGWQDSVDCAVWIDEARRTEIRNRGLGIKIPAILFEKTIIIEDGGLYDNCFDVVWEDDSLFATVYENGQALFAHLNLGTWTVDKEKFFNETNELNELNKFLNVDLVKKYLIRLGWLKQ